MAAVVVVIVVVAVSRVPASHDPSVAEAGRCEGEHEEEAGRGCDPGHGGQLVTRNLKWSIIITSLGPFPNPKS